MSTGKWRRLFHGFILQYHIDQPQFSVENNAGSRDQERLFFLLIEHLISLYPVHEMDIAS